MPRLNDALIANERYRGEPSTDDGGRTQWPVHILWDDEIPGFGVRVHPPVRGKTSRKDFIVTWKLGLKSRMMAIGTFGVDCTLRQARRAAREALDLARRGQDPIEARQRALGIGTTEDLASRFLFEHTSAARKKATGGEPAPGAAPGAAVGAATDAPSASSSTETPAADDAPATSESAAAPAEGAPAAEPAASRSDAAMSDAETNAAVSAADAETAPEAGLEPEAALPATPSSTGPAGAPAPAAVTAPHLDETRRAAPIAPQAKRGPTKVRLLPVPESLYRTLEQGARQSEMTIAAYLNALLDIARAAVGDELAGAASSAGVGEASEDTAPALKDLLARVQEAQAVEVGERAQVSPAADRGKGRD